MRYTTLLSRQFYRQFHWHFARRVLVRHAVALVALSSSAALALADPPEPDVAPLSPETQAVLREILNYDPLRTTTMKPTTPLRVPSQKASGHDLDWNRTDKPDGSSALTVKKPLPLEWDANVGADFGLAAAPGTSYLPDRPLPLTKEQNSGAAWATVRVPGVASIDARVDQNREQSKLGTTLSRSLPIGSGYSVTLQNGFSLTETLGPSPAAPATPGSVPGTSGLSPPAQVWSTDRLVKFNILSSGTTLAAGTTSSTADNVLRNKISAEQKFFESLNVTTALTDVGGGRPSSKSITAGFKLKW